MKKFLSWLFPVLTALLIAFIFWNSFQDADASNDASSKFLFLFGGDMFWIRKTAHFAEFTLLGVLLTLDARKTDLKKAVGWLICAAVIVALTDETIQSFSIGRSSEVRDVWIDTAGAALGIFVTTGFLLRKGKK